LIFKWEFKIGSRSSNEYELLGGFVRLIGKSRKILCDECFFSNNSNSVKSFIHARFIL
jgi:hypothetical protein